MTNRKSNAVLPAAPKTALPLHEAAMSEASRKTYRVTLQETTCFSVEIAAKSGQAAEARARAMWDSNDTGAFSVRSVSLDYVDAELS